MLYCAPSLLVQIAHIDGLAVENLILQQILAVGWLERKESGECLLEVKHIDGIANLMDSREEGALGRIECL